MFDRAAVADDNSTVGPGARLTAYPDYGVDALGVVVGFFAGSAGLAISGALTSGELADHGHG